MKPASSRPWGFDIPGGFVTTERRGGVSLIQSILRNLTFSVRGVEQDIVIKDGPHGRELFREGPYSQVSVELPLRQILSDIQNIGLKEFLRRQQIDNAQLGPVVAPSGRQEFPLLSYLGVRLTGIFRRRR